MTETTGPIEWRQHGRVQAPWRGLAKLGQVLLPVARAGAAASAWSDERSRIMEGDLGSRLEHGRDALSHLPYSVRIKPHPPSRLRPSASSSGHPERHPARLLTLRRAAEHSADAIHPADRLWCDRRACHEGLRRAATDDTS